MEIVPNLRPIVFWLKVRTRGPQPSICVPTFSQFTSAALDYAHASGVVHLDLEPLNLLVHNDGRLLLADFGLARLMKQGVVAGHTWPEDCQHILALGPGSPLCLS
jgi:serine/threonine protein kinase